MAMILQIIIIMKVEISMYLQGPILYCCEKWNVANPPDLYLDLHSAYLETIKCSLLHTPISMHITIKNE